MYGVYCLKRVMLMLVGDATEVVLTVAVDAEFAVSTL
jgi:hypothetical protein